MILNQGHEVRIIKLQKVCALAWVDIDYNPNPDLTLTWKSTPTDKAQKIHDGAITVEIVVCSWNVFDFLHFSFCLLLCVSIAAGAGRAPLKIQLGDDEMRLHNG